MVDKTIRLFVPTGVYPPDIGGPATYVPLIEKHLPAHGFEVAVLPFRTVRFLPKGISHLVYFFHCLRFARRADVVYAQDAVSVGWPALLASIITRRPFVVKIVGDHVWEQGRQRFRVKKELDDFPFWPWHPYLIFLRILQQIVVRCAKKVVVPSEYLRAVVLRWGIKSERVALVYNGIEIPAEIPNLPVEPKRPLIVSVGRLTPWKGFRGIIDTLTREPSWRLTIVGGGPEHRALESYAREGSVLNRVRFTGLLPRRDTLAWCKGADVFVLNSSYEGLPHMLIEAMALGTPVVASDIPANREVITHGEGLVVPLGDIGALSVAITKALDKGEDTQRRIAAAHVRASEFSVSQTMTGLARVLKQVCVS